MQQIKTLASNVRHALHGARSSMAKEIKDLRTKSVRSRFVARPEDAFATHMPVLIGVANLIKPKAVLELGTGKFSTPAFLNRQCFPTLTKLVSLENVPDWSRQVREIVGDDPRFTLVDVPSVPDHLASMDLSGFDLIFVDDSGDIPTRTRSLRTVLQKAPPRAVVVVHDFEVRSYNQSAPREWNPRSFEVWRPFTGVLSRAPLDLAPLDRKLKEGRSTPPSALQFWSQALR